MENSLQRRYKAMDIFAQEETSNFAVIVLNAADALSLVLFLVHSLLSEPLQSTQMVPYDQKVHCLLWLEKKKTYNKKLNILKTVQYSKLHLLQQLLREILI